MPRSIDPNSRTTPVTIKVTRSEAELLRRMGGSTGKGLRKVLADHIKWAGLSRGAMKSDGTAPAGYSRSKEETE